MATPRQAGVINSAGCAKHLASVFVRAHQGSDMQHLASHASESLMKMEAAAAEFMHAEGMLSELIGRGA